MWRVVDVTHVELRAERNGDGKGRIYSITSTCMDAAGNAATGTITVTVPHDMRK
jgi:hypothetical protein